MKNNYETTEKIKKQEKKRQIYCNCFTNKVICKLCR